MAYLESASNESLMSMAAKGGKVSQDDLEIIKQELEKRKADHE